MSELLYFCCIKLLRKTSFLAMVSIVLRSMLLPSFSGLPLFLSSMVLAVSIVDASGVAGVCSSISFELCIVIFCFFFTKTWQHD